MSGTTRVVLFAQLGRRESQRPSRVFGAHLRRPRAASEHYRMLEDGERARMIEMRLPPGASDNEPHGG